MHKDICILGLGETGSLFLERLLGLLKDRMMILDARTRESVTVFTLPLPLKGGFDFMKVSALLEETLVGSNAKINNEEVKYIVFGNLREPSVCTQSVHIANLLHLRDREKQQRKGDLVGFYALNDALGTVQKMGDDGGIAINKFLDDCALCSYTPVYKTADGMDFKPIELGSSPWDRLYIGVSPGGEEVLIDATLQVFAERIFYEIYFFDEIYKDLNRQVHNYKIDPQNRGRVFSTFSLVQVPRLSELQRYYLKYQFHLEAMVHHLTDDLVDVDEDYVSDQWMRSMGLDPKGDMFPLNKMVTIFLDRYAPNLSSFVKPYVGGQKPELFIENSRTALNTFIEELRPNYTSFINEEIRNFNEVLQIGLRSLMTLYPLSGAFKIYQSFVTRLQEQIEAWNKNIEDQTAVLARIDHDLEWEKALLQIKELEKKTLLKNFLFSPIRTELIQHILASVPVREMLRKDVTIQIGSLLSRQFLVETVNPTHPLHLIFKIQDSLTAYISLFRTKSATIKEKQDKIEKLTSYYYVISPKKPEDFKLVLERVKEKEFGSHRKHEHVDTIRRLFTNWVKDRQILDLIGSGSEYFSSLEQYCDDKLVPMLRVDDNRIDRDLESNFFTTVVDQVRKRSMNLNEKSFSVGYKENYLLQRLLVLNPDQDYKDELYDSVEMLRKSTEPNCTIHPIHSQFTVGSVLFIKEFLFLEQSSFAKYSLLDKYRSIIPANVDTARDFVLDPAMTKHISGILREYLVPQVLEILYRDQMGREKKDIQKEDLEAVSATLTLEKTLDLLNDDQLRSVARDYDLMVVKDRAQQIRIIKSGMEK